MKHIWELFNYKTPAKYFINKSIREYDLSRANVSALLYMNRISKQEYDSYIAMPKYNREIMIGKWIRKDKSVYQDIQAGIIEAKKQFILSNHIDDEDIIAIHNDAISFIGSQKILNEFNPFIFRLEGSYSSFLQLQDLEVYYNFNPFQEDVLNIKGINVKEGHTDNLLTVIKQTCRMIQQQDARYVLKWLCNFYNNFMDRKLDKEMYRNLDTSFGYTIHTAFHTIVLDDINPDMICQIDINRNLNILRDLIAIVSDIYRYK